MFLRKLALSGTSVHKNFKSVTNFHQVKEMKPLKFRSNASLLSFSKPITCSLHTGTKVKTPRRALGQTPNIKKRYSTENLIRYSESMASQIQPFLDIENVIKNEGHLQASIDQRKLTRAQVSEVKKMYDRAQECKALAESVKQLRTQNKERCLAIMKDESRSQSEREKEVEELKEKGRQLREEIRTAENKFNEANDNLVDLILSLPNTLDKETPLEEPTLLKEVSPSKEPPWENPEYVAIETQCGPGLLAEFPVGSTAWLDIDLRGRAQSHLLKAGFIETGNAEYVKRIILHGAGIDHSQFCRIREPNVKKGLEHAAYLAGGASFPSFLALFSQSIIEEESILPLRYFVIGRSYESNKNKPGYYQSHAVQVIVACRNEEEMEKEALNLQTVMEAFYSEKVGFTFQTQIVPAPRLQMYEKKKLAFVMNETGNSPRKVIGTLSTVGDYVSKRLLCCYFNDKKRSNFLHLITAKFFDITHFLRSPNPKLISHNEIFNQAPPPPDSLKVGDQEDSKSQ